MRLAFHFLLPDTGDAIAVCFKIIFIQRGQHILQPATGTVQMAFHGSYREFENLCYLVAPHLVAIKQEHGGSLRRTQFFYG